MARRGGGAQSNDGLQPQVLLGVMWPSGEVPEYQAWVVVAWLKAGRQVGKLLAMALVTGGNAGDRATGEADPALRSWNICGVGGNCRFCKV